MYFLTETNTTVLINVDVIEQYLKMKTIYYYYFFLINIIQHITSITTNLCLKF